MAKPKSGQRIKHMLIHEFTLKNPLNDGCPYDEYAAKVIQAILVRLSILPNLIQDSADAHVSGLTVNGEIVIRVTANGVFSQAVGIESTREQFLLNIHNALCTTKISAAQPA
jgi:hypothetical protein